MSHAIPSFCRQPPVIRSEVFNGRKVLTRLAKFTIKVPKGFQSDSKVGYSIRLRYQRLIFSSLSSQKADQRMKKKLDSGDIFALNYPLDWTRK